MAKSKVPAPLTWESWELAEGERRSWAFGPLRIWAEAAEKEWKLAWSLLDDVRKRRSAPPPPDPEWARWAAPGRDSVLQFSPVLPDLPLVARPENPFRILPNERARVFVSVPAWVRVTAGRDAHHVLVDVPSRVLSKSWLGSPTEGELCLWTRTRARREWGDTPEHIVTAPLVLANRSRETLRVEKVFIRLPHLSVYDAEGVLWADTTHVAYTGTDETDTVKEEGEAPLEAPEAARLSPPRSRPREGLMAFSFSPLRLFSEWGF
jgi:hypothetical protein